jgi:hypothetical protein
MGNKCKPSVEQSEGVRTEPITAVQLVATDQIVMPDGSIATVGPVTLHSPGSSMRARKRPKCRIRVTIHGQSGTSYGTVTAEPDDCFDKLVGVEQS